MIECLLKNRPNAPSDSSKVRNIGDEIYEALQSIDLGERRGGILSACELQPSNLLKIGLAEIIQEAFRDRCDQGGETMLVCESVIRLDEDNTKITKAR